MALGGIILYIQSLQNTQEQVPVTPGYLFSRIPRAYAPRKGLRAVGKLPSGVPTGMFIGSAAVTRSRTSAQVAAIVLQGVDTILVGGDVTTFVMGPSGRITKSGP